MIRGPNQEIRSNKTMDYLCSTRTFLRRRGSIGWVGAIPVWPALRSERQLLTRLALNTDFWGPASNFGIPIAAILDTNKSPDLWESSTDWIEFRLLHTDKAFSISGQMTGALIIYAFTFMRYSLAVIPKNYLLFAAHFLNAGAQPTQGYRWTMYHYGAGADGKAGKIASVWEF